MKGLGPAISMSGMVACGMLFCLASGDFDLSVASVIACAGVTTAVVINLTESLWIGVAAGCCWAFSVARSMALLSPN